MAATMKDVAKRAGVSIATVSFLVNNTKRVTPETRLRIETAMADLGFRRNVVARALASRRTRIIALVYPALEHRIGGSIADFITSAARASSEADYHLVVWPISNDATELTALVGQGLVDGVLLMEVQLEDARVEVLRNLDIPFALIGRTRDPSGLDYVDIDFDTSMQLAMNHLIDFGHRDTVLLSGSQEAVSYRLYGPYEREEAAYRRIAEEHGMRPVVLRCAQSAVAGREAARRLVAEAPEATAVLAADEASAAGLVAGLHQLGRRIPADISVISVLTSKEMAAVSDPPLTLVTAPGLELGALGVEALLRRLHGDPPQEPVLRAGILELGESTGRVSARTPSRRRRSSRFPQPTSSR
jgi:DNA-binding LacI/PurR family transcriptional regulator